MIAVVRAAWWIALFGLGCGRVVVTTGGHEGGGATSSNGATGATDGSTGDGTQTSSEATGSSAEETTSGGGMTESTGAGDGGSGSSDGGSSSWPNMTTSTGDGTFTTTQGTSASSSDASTTGTPSGGAVCGDGAVQAPEECDDGNLDSFDGCSEDCVREIVDLALGPSVTCVLALDGQVKCWGANQNGELGLGDDDHRGDEPGEMGSALPFVDLAMDVAALSNGRNNGQTCALSPDGDTKCWGSNAAGGLGLGNANDRGDEIGEMGSDLPFVDVGGPAVLNLSTFSGACAVLVGGSLKCWGANWYGQLGLGDTEHRGNESGEMGDALPYVDLGDFVPVSVARGTHACAVSAVGELKCWGSNGDGRLGLGDTEDRGDEPGEMGDALPVVDFGDGAVAEQVSVSYNTCVLLQGGEVKCWGSDSSGLLAWPGVAGPVGDEPGEMGDALPTIDVGGVVEQLELGGLHACVLLEGGDVRCWGANDDGQLGQGNTDPFSGSVADLLPIDLGTDERAVLIAAGGGHACAVLESGCLKCWGGNIRGQLGYGDTEARGDEPGEMGDNLPCIEVF